MMGDGMMLCIDAKAPESLTETSIRHYLETAPSHIGMTPISGPHIYALPDGWHGHLVIAESHISVDSHGLAVFIDIFSCKPFDTGRALRVTCDLLGLDRGQTKYHTPIHRGWTKTVI